MSFIYDERIDGPLATVDRATLVAALHAAAPGLDVLHERDKKKLKTNKKKRKNENKHKKADEEKSG